MRYRERKRQKTAGLEEQVQQLSAKLAEQQRLAQEQQVLASQNKALQQQLQLKLRELDDAKAMTPRSSDSQATTRGRARSSEVDLQPLVKKWLSTVCPVCACAQGSCGRSAQVCSAHDRLRCPVSAVQVM